MFKKKIYTFSPENLTFTEAYKNKKDKYIKILPFFAAGFLLCAAIISLLLSFGITPGEKKLVREKKELENKFILLDTHLKEVQKRLNELSLKDDSLYRIILGTKPLPESVKAAGKGGSVNKFLTMESGNFNLIDSLAQNLNQLYSKIEVLDYSFNDILKLAENNREKMAHLPAIMPIFNKDLKGTGAGFGMRIHPILGINRMHEGIDFYAGKGTDVYATANGVVSQVRYSNTFGNIVEIDHGFGYETYYGHLSKFKVKKGQKVKRGEVIGLVGSTGLSSGMHLHYEVHLNGKEINPIYYFYADLTPTQYKQIIELSEREMYSMD